MCCHPALTASSAIALTLRAVGGLTTSEIANAFLVPESTMAQRISRAKQTIKASRDPFRMPTKREHARRLSSVLHTLYLDLQRRLHEQRRRLAAPRRAVERGDSADARDLPPTPDDPEVAGLLALMLLTDARRPARTGPEGELIPLDKQDRQLWNREAIAEGVALVSRYAAEGSGRPVSAPGGDRRGSRRSRDAGRDRLAADSRALHPARADVR